MGGIHSVQHGRLSSDLRCTDDDGERALELYESNEEASSGSHRILGAFEVTLWHSMNDCLERAYGRHWFAEPRAGLDRGAQAAVDEELHRLGRRRGPFEPLEVFEALTLGFWARLLTRGDSVGRNRRTDGATMDTTHEGKRNRAISVQAVLPARLLSRKLEGTLFTPVQRPDCEVPDTNSGTVTVEASIDPETGKHRYLGAWASGKRIDQFVLAGCAGLVCDTWSSEPLRFAYGSQVELLAGETIRLTVDFPIRRAASR